MLFPFRLMKALIEVLRPLLPLNQIVDYQQSEIHRRSKRAIQEGQHTFVVGKSGMGKTKLIKEWIHKKLSIQPDLNVYHIDTKKRGDFSSYDGTMILSEEPPPAFTTSGNKMVWQALIDNKDNYTKFFLSILNAGLPALVNIDEAINMNFNGEPPRGLSILIAQGRLPGIHVIGGTQEVARAPRQLLSQASTIIGFNVINKYDMFMMKEFLRIPKEIAYRIKKYQFWCIRPDEEDKPTLYNSYEDWLVNII
jgi:hypothetical protein